MFEKPVVSIIVPMYNAEKTIGRCIESLLCQTLTKIEIIIIDDASTDMGLSIVENYAKNHNNLHIIQNKKNMGSGAAKNRGIDNAQANIIGFCDADDYVGKTYYEILYNALIKYDADIACCDMALVFDDHTEYLQMMINNIYNILYGMDNNHCKINEPVFICPEIASAHGVSASATTKLFRTRIINKFFEGACDDLLFTYSALFSADKIVYVPNNFYHYIQTSNSLERSEFNENRLTLGDCLTETVNMLSASSKNYSEISKIVYAYSSWGILLDILQKKDQRETYIKTYYEKLKYRKLLEDNIYLKQVLLSKPIGEQFFILDLIRLFIQEKFQEAFDLFDKYNSCRDLYLPKVSIVIPVFNGSNYLEEAIKSALIQTYPNLEILVINDGSEDDGKTERIAKSFGSRIRYFYKKNGGVATALNFGIQKMTGEYFSWLSHDDLYKEDKVLRQIEALQQYLDKKTIVVSGYTLVNEKKEKLYDISPLSQYSREQLETPLFAVFRGCVNGCAALIHKSHFERVGNFNANLPTTQDYDLWFRIMRNQKICFMPGNYVLSRVHDQQDSKKLHTKHYDECNRLWINLFEQLRLDEIQEMAKNSYTFYKEERDFFIQSPYERVKTYLDLKLLELIIPSWRLGKREEIRKLGLLFGFPTKISQSQDLLHIAANSNRKTAIILSENDYNESSMQRTLNAICNYKQENTLILIKLSHSDIFKCEESKISTILFPSSEADILPHTLKLLDCEMAIISDSSCCLRNELCSKCSVMGITVVSWNLTKHWLLLDNQSILEKQKRILENRSATLTVWSDKESWDIDSIKSNSTTYIPLIEESTQSTNILKKWEDVLSSEAAQKNNDIPVNANPILNLFYEQSENFILWQAEHTETEIQTVEKIVTIPDESTYWEEYCKAVLNSTSWKLTKPLRYLMDSFKTLLHRQKG